MTPQTVPLPGISIVIITRGRVALVEELLVSLDESRRHYDGPQEVLVVDDSKADDAAQLAALCAAHGAQLSTCGPSVSTKRNAGAARARYEILLFLDSDCRATASLLCEHAACYRDPRVGAVLGLVDFFGPDCWTWKVIEKTPFVIPFAFPKYMETAPWGPTANFSVRTDIFRAIGGFDETFPPKPGGEDVDLGLRITGAGRLICCRETALVHHSKETWVSLGAICQRLFHWGRTECYLAQRHPDRLVVAVPRKSLVYFVTFLLFLIAFGLTRKPCLAAIFPAWIAVDLVLQAALQLLWAGKPLRHLPHQLAAILLVMVNETGMVCEMMHQRRWSCWIAQMLYTPGQIEGEWHFGSSKLWGLLLSLWMAIGAAFLL